MRNIYGTAHCSTASSSTSFGTSQVNERVLWLNIKARAGNANPIYVGSSSAVNSTNGYELQAGDSLPEEYRDDRDGASVAGNRFWFVASDTTSNLDYAMGVDD